MRSVISSLIYTFSATTPIKKSFTLLKRSITRVELSVPNKYLFVSDFNFIKIGKLRMNEKHPEKSNGC